MAYQCAIFAIITLLLSFGNTAFADDHLLLYDNETGGACSQIGVWDYDSLTCTLTQNVSQPIVIEGSGITLDGSGYGIVGNGEAIGVHAVWYRDVTIKNSTISGFDRAIMLQGSGPQYFSNVQRAQIFNNTLVGNEVGLYLYYTTEATITDNVIRTEWGGDAGLSLFGSSGNRIEDNQMQGGYSGIKFRQHSSGNVVVRNKIVGESIGVYMSNVDNNKVYGNEILYPASKEGAYIGSTKSMNNTFHTESEGGNNWERFNEVDEGCVDENTDGYCDTPFNIPGDPFTQDLKPIATGGAAVREPVIIIPGLVASYNAKCILKDKECSVGAGWGFAPSVNWFDSLITRLEGEGYVQGKSLFIAFYDWRNPNVDAAKQYLDPIIDFAQKQGGSEKVDIVAHSMGGLVARAYAQSDYYEDDIDQIVMLGTPNEGAADAYYVWESGEFPERWDIAHKFWISRIEYHLSRARDARGINRPRLLRYFFPSLRDLIPINSFLTRSNTELAVVSPDMVSDNINTFLINLRDTKSLLADRGIDVLTIAGTGHKTLGTLALDSKSELLVEDVIAERWRDGKANPNPPQPDSVKGDQTVLTSSVDAVGTLLAIVDAKHEELPSNNTVQRAVIAALTSNENPKVDYIPTKLATSAVGIDILSPVMPVLILPNGEEITVENADEYSNIHFDYDSSDPTGTKIITIVDAAPGSYMVDLHAMEEKGEYTVVVSYADENDLLFEEYSGDTSLEEPKDFSFTVSSDTAVIELPDVSGGESGVVLSSESSSNDMDCCPGVDSEDPAVRKRAGKVLGVTRGSVDPWRKLKPINALFRSVFGRNPTYEEWLYWANRLLLDKPQHDALLGAMQWQMIH